MITTLFPDNQPRTIHSRPPRLSGGSRPKTVPVAPRKQLRAAQRSERRAYGGAAKYAGHGPQRVVPLAVVAPTLLQQAYAAGQASMEPWYCSGQPAPRGTVDGSWIGD